MNDNQWIASLGSSGKKQKPMLLVLSPCAPWSMVFTNCLPAISASYSRFDINLCRIIRRLRFTKPILEYAGILAVIDHAEAVAAVGPLRADAIAELLSLLLIVLRIIGVGHT